MITHYQRELQHNYLIMKQENTKKGEQIGENDYRVPMLSHNKVDGLLPVKVHYENGGIDFYYEISSKQSLDRIVEKIPIDYSRLKRLIKSVKRVLQELELYLLPEDGLLLRPEYIYINMDTGEYAFCYYPWWHESAKDGMHQLLEYLLNYLDYQDKSGVAAAYEWYRLSGMENFALNEMEVVFDSQERQNIKNEDINEDNKKDTLPKPLEIEGEYMPEWEDNEKQTLNGGLFHKLFKKKEPLVEHSVEKVNNSTTIQNKTENNNVPIICESSSDYRNDENSIEQRDSTMFLNQGTQAVTRRLLCKNSANEPDFLLTKLPFVIGKGEDWADGVLKSRSVSRMHAQIECVEGEYYIRDLNSTNGTFVNGQLLEMNETVKLELGDRIGFAEIEYDFL